MSKKRPKQPSSGAARTVLARRSKLEPAYWLNRVFKSLYVYRGQRLQVRNWAVKIQHGGRRKTFALKSTHRRQAAAEACQLYRGIIRLPAGPQAGSGRTGFSDPASPERAGNAAGPRADTVRFWAERLIRRDYSTRFPGETGPELSARVDHEGTGHYFPLGTIDPKLAARRALEIHRCVAAHGWETANQRFRRELTVAFRWLESPLAWTYTTILTQPGAALAPVREGTRDRLEIAIADSDVGTRQALASYVDHMEGFRCAKAYDHAASALGDLPQSPVRLVLASRNLADMPGGVFVEEMKAAAPLVPVLLYSVYEDSEELFKTTPGGAPLYTLRRTPPTGFLDPIVETLRRGSLSTNEIAPIAWQYFKSILTSLPIGAPDSPLASLTPREQEVLGLLSRGCPDKEIARRLGISAYTVHEHVRNTFEKLGVHNRIEAVVKFLQK